MSWKTCICTWFTFIQQTLSIKCQTLHTYFTDTEWRWLSSVVICKMILCKHKIQTGMNSNMIHNHKSGWKRSLVGVSGPLYNLEMHFTCRDTELPDRQLSESPWCESASWRPPIYWAIGPCYVFGHYKLPRVWLSSPEECDTFQKQEKVKKKKERKQNIEQWRKKPNQKLSLQYICKGKSSSKYYKNIYLAI